MCVRNIIHHHCVKLIHHAVIEISEDEKMWSRERELSSDKVNKKYLNSIK